MAISSDDTAWLEEQLTAVETQIRTLQAAINRVASQAQSYSMDTGQTRITKAEAELMGLRLALKDAEDRRKEIRNELGLPNAVGRVVTVLPGW